jgi:hypothetical protein
MLDRRGLRVASAAVGPLLWLAVACSSPAGVPAGAGGAGGDDAPAGGAGGARPAGSGGTVGAGGSSGASGSAGGRAGDGGGGGASGASGSGGATASPDARADVAGSGGSGGSAPAPDAGAADRSSTPPPPPVGGVFRHPGVLVNKGQLDFIREKVNAGEQPWKAAYDKARADNYGSLTYTPKPFATVECGSYSNPNIGCAEEMNDSIAAYTQALLFAIDGDEAHARKAIEIMNAWARTLKAHTNSNAPLQAGWTASLWPRAGEIIRSGYGGWPPAEIDAFKGMLKNVYLPLIIKGSGGTNGNWELTMMEGSIGIAVFADDKASFDRAVATWRKRVPDYFYIKSDGGSPPWGGPALDGICQETCRDFLHTQLGFGAAINLAETAFNQGLDLYKEHSERFRAAMEFHADYLLGKPAGSLCGGSLDLRVLPTWEVAYNHYKNRMGIELPLTRRLIVEKARAIDPTYKHMSWETLTHADVGWAGLK